MCRREICESLCIINHFVWRLLSFLLKMILSWKARLQGKWKKKQMCLLIYKYSLITFLSIGFQCGYFVKGRNIAKLLRHIYLVAKTASSFLHFIRVSLESHPLVSFFREEIHLFVEDTQWSFMLVAFLYPWLSFQVKDSATELAKAMEEEDGVTGAVQAFYKQFPRRYLESDSHPPPERLSRWRLGALSARQCFGCSWVFPTSRFCFSWLNSHCRRAILSCVPKAGSVCIILMLMASSHWCIAINRCADLHNICFYSFPSPWYFYGGFVW